MTADPQHIDTIRKALIEQRGDIFAAIGYQTTVTASDEMVVELAAIEAALAALDTPTTPRQVDANGLQELKSCPFCGGNAIAEKMFPEHEFYEAGCENDCASFQYLHSMAEAIAAWNRRTTTPPPMPSAIPDDVRVALEIAKRSNMTALAFLRREGMRVPVMSAEMARDIDILMAEERTIQAALAWLDEQQRPPAAHVPPRRG